MQRADVVYVNYECSDTITCQGTRNSIRSYLDKGYYVKVKRNGYWVLVRPATVTVLLENEDGETQRFNIKNEILEYYGKKQISQSLVERFEQECQDGTIKFYFQGDTYYFE